MNIWMIYTITDYKKNEQYYKMHIEKGAKYNMDIQLILVEYLSFGVLNNKHYIMYNNKSIDLPDCVIMRSRYSLLSRQLELLNIPVYNNSYVCDICNDKAKTYQLLASQGIDIIDSEYILSDKLYTVMQSKDDIQCNNINQTSIINDSTNKIIKTVNGHGGNEVFLLNEFLNNTTKHPRDMVMQPFIKGNNEDVRVYILNNEIKASVLRTGNVGYKSNYSLGGSVSSYDLQDNEREIVYKIIDIFKKNTHNYYVKGLFYVGIDFIINENGMLLFNEIEDVVGSRMLYNTSEIDIVDEYLKCILQSC